MTALAVDGSGTVWAGTRDGRLFFCSAGSGWRLMPAPLRGWGSINALTTADGVTWIGSQRGLFSLDAGGRIELVASSGADQAVTAIEVDPAGGVWAGTTGVRDGTGHLIHATPAGSDIVRLYPDLAVTPTAHGVIDVELGPDSLWAATTASGVVGIRPADTGRPSLHDVASAELPTNRTTGLVVDGSGSAWVGTWQGLARLGTGVRTPTILHAGALGDDRVTAVAVGSDGAVWAGTFAGTVARVGSDGGTNRVELAGPVLAIEPADEGVWVAAGGARISIVTELGEAAALDAPGTVGALATGPDGSLWVGASGSTVTRVTRCPAGLCSTTTTLAHPPVADTNEAEQRERDLVEIPPGEFVMGSDSGRPDAAPARLVYLDGFSIQRSEVTNAQYRRFVVATGAAPLPTWVAGFFGLQEGDLPAAGVAWDEASAYCAWAGMRLPTEAEWEKAARGTDARPYPWGWAWDSHRSNASGVAPDPVGGRPEGASPYGVLDLSGNVAEWVADYYDPDYYREAPDRNPPGPVVVMGHVQRGGSWASPIDQVTTTFRDASHSGTPDLRAGFRCAAATPY